MRCLSRSSVKLSDRRDHRLRAQRSADSPQARSRAGHRRARLPALRPASRRFASWSSRSSSRSGDCSFSPTRTVVVVSARRAVASVDPELPLVGLRPMAEVVSAASARRFAAALAWTATKSAVGEASDSLGRWFPSASFPRTCTKRAALTFATPAPQYVRAEAS
jgi:hypothetical protein